jgi:hypothetical protein
VGSSSSHKSSKQVANKGQEKPEAKSTVKGDGGGKVKAIA